MEGKELARWSDGAACAFVTATETSNELAGCADGRVEHSTAEGTPSVEDKELARWSDGAASAFVTATEATDDNDSWVPQGMLFRIVEPGAGYDLVQVRVVLAVRGERWIVVQTSYLLMRQPASGPTPLSTCHRRLGSLEAADPGRPAPSHRTDPKSTFVRTAVGSCEAPRVIVTRVRPLGKLHSDFIDKRILVNIDWPLPCPAASCWMGVYAESGY